MVITTLELIKAFTLIDIQYTQPRNKSTHPLLLFGTNMLDKLQALVVVTLALTVIATSL